jgi:hypothetical protein
MPIYLRLLDVSYLEAFREICDRVLISSRGRSYRDPTRGR